MMHLAIRRAIRCPSCITLLLLTLSLCFTAGSAFAAAIGDQVELNATHPAGVPFHSAPGGTPKFQRVPDGTVATVIDSARELAGREPPVERSHDSRTYGTRFMLRLDDPTQEKLEELSTHFEMSAAEIIRHLIAQATPEDFPRSWHMRAAERRVPQARQ